MLKQKPTKIGVLFLGLALLFSAQTTFAVTAAQEKGFADTNKHYQEKWLAQGAPQGTPAKDPCQVYAENNNGDGKTRSIPDSFSVGDCLKADGQSGRFLPKKEGVKEVQNGQNGGDIRNAIVEFINLLIKMIGALALIVFILGALLAIVSEGKEDRLDKGKTAMTYAIYGLILAFFSFVIVTFVQSILF